MKCRYRASLNRLSENQFAASISDKRDLKYKDKRGSGGTSPIDNFALSSLDFPFANRHFH
jgi:hypothetical protein